MVARACASRSSFARPQASSPSSQTAFAAREVRAELAALLPELRVRAMRLCGERAAADDAVQDTFERALRFADQYQRGTNLRAWAQQILFSVFVTRWRRRRRERSALEGLAADPCAWTTPPGFVPPDAGAGALTRSTRRKLQSLPDGFREAVVMVDLRELSYRDAARELGVPVGTVMSRLHRGRKLLAAQMAGEHEAA